MNKVRAIAVVRLGPGTRLALNAEQAGDRKHALRPIAKGIFETTQPVEFKAGESFGIEGDLPKALFESLEGEGIPAAAQAAAAPKKPGGKKAAAAPAEPDAPPPAEGEQ